MNLSQHAVTRCQQRNIQPELIQILALLGMEVQQKGNTYVLQLDRKCQRELSKKLKALLMQVQRNVYVVVSEDDTIITAAHKH